MEEDSTKLDQGPRPPGQPPPTLDYRTPQKLPPEAKAQFAWGIIIGLVCMGVAVPLGILWSIASNSGGLFWLCAGGVALLINVAATMIYRTRNKPRLAIGLWIGFGIALLINGACFAILTGEPR
jgi:hypothetical protein